MTIKRKFFKRQKLEDETEIRMRVIDHGLTVAETAHKVVTTDMYVDTVAMAESRDINEMKGPILIGMVGESKVVDISDPDAGLKTLPKLSEDERRQLIDGKAIGITDLNIDPKCVCPGDTFRVNMSQLGMQVEAAIDSSMVIGGTRVFRMNDALGFHHSIFACFYERLSP